MGSENPNPLHFNAVSYPLTYRLFVSGHSINTGARLLPPSSSAVPPDLLPLDLKVFTSHHEARNSSVTLLVCFKPQWEPCARVLWDWSPPWKKLFLIPVKQHGLCIQCKMSFCCHNLCEERRLWPCYVTTSWPNLKYGRNIFPV